MKKYIDDYLYQSDFDYGDYYTVDIVEHYFVPFHVIAVTNFANKNSVTLSLFLFS